MKSTTASKPHLIIMVGIPGSGKSFFAEHFAETFNAPLISFHRIRHELFSSPTFSKNENAIIGQVANYILEEVLKTGRTIVYEGQTDTHVERGQIAKKSRDAGYKPLFIWVQTEPDTARKRATKANSDRPALTVDQYNECLKRFSVPNQAEKPVVISGKHTYASQLKIVLKHLIEPHTPAADAADRSSRSLRNRSFLIR